MGCNASKEVKDKEGDAPYTPTKAEKGGLKGDEHGGEEIVKSSSANTQSAAPPKPERSPEKAGENGHVQKGNLSPNDKGPGDYSSLDKSATLRRDKERAKLEFFGIDPDTKQKKQRSPEPDFSVLDRKLGIATQQSPHKLYDPPMDKDGYVKGAAQQIQKKADVSDEGEAPVSPPAWIGEREKGGTGNVKEKVIYMEHVKEGKVDSSLRLSHSPSPRQSYKSEEDGDEEALKGNESVKVEGNHMAEYGKGLLENVHREDVQLIKDREYGKDKEGDQVEEGGVDPAKQGALQEDRFYNNKAFEKPDVDPSDPQQQDAALTIQTKYRQFNAKKVVSEKKEEQAAVKIQAGFRGYQDRQRVKKLRAGETEPHVEEADGDDAAEEVDIDLDDPDVAEAASKIQAGFKGYKARKEVQAMKAEKAGEQDKPATQTEEADEEIDIDLNDPEVEKAATKIQAGFKGYKTRKDIASKDIGSKQTDGSDSLPAATVAEQEEIDIDLNDPEVEKAAIKIQAGFSRFKSKKQSPSTVQEPIQEKPTEVPGENNEQGEEIDIDLNDPEVEKAAIKIQAKFSKFKSRKSNLMGTSNPSTEHNSELVRKTSTTSVVSQASILPINNQKTQELQEEVIDIDLEDPEVEKAALKIQSRFSKLKLKKKSSIPQESQNDKTTSYQQDFNIKSSVAGGSDTDKKTPTMKEIDIDLKDPEVEKAALKIQNRFSKSHLRKVGSLPEKNTEKCAISSKQTSVDLPLTKKNCAVIHVTADTTKSETEGAAMNSKTEGSKLGIQKTRLGKNSTKQEETMDKPIEPEAAAQLDSKPEIDSEIDIDLNDPEVEKAATKIQAGFKGFKARKEVKSLKEGVIPECADPSADQADIQASASDEPATLAAEDNTKSEIIGADTADTELENVQPDTELEEDKDEMPGGEQAPSVPTGKEDAEGQKLAVETVQEGELKATPLADAPIIEDANGREAQPLADFTPAESTLPLSADCQTELEKEAEDKVAQTQDVNSIEPKEDADDEAAPEEAEEEKVDIDLSDPEVEKAASKIQAGFKGMKTRQELAATKATGEEAPEAAAVQEGEATEKETIDIDLNDPEVEKAATKIQAGFKGMKTRQEMAASKEASPEKEDKPEVEEKPEGKESKPEDGEGEDIDIDLNDPEVEKAATKIQAGFKGMKTRKELKGSKEGSAEPEGGPGVEEGLDKTEGEAPPEDGGEPKAE